MKKVLIITNNFGVGGTERLLVDAINEMLVRDIPVFLVTLKKEKEHSSLFSSCKIREDKCLHLNFSGIFDLKNIFNLIIYIAKIKPDVVFTHLWFSNTIGRVSSKLAGVSKVISFEHNIYDSVKTPKMFFVDRMLQYLSFKIIAVSNSVKESLIRHGINPNKIEVIYNGIDMSKYDDVTDDRSKYGLETSDFVFVSVGRLIPQKGMDILIQSFSALKGLPKLLIVGQGEREGEYKTLAHDLGVAERVMFLGVSFNIPAILKMSDCFVLASRYEGFGIVVVEAMASGLPVVITDFNASGELVENGQDGIIVPSENIQQLTQAMERIMIDGTLRENLKIKSKVKSDTFSIKRHVDKIMQLI